MRTGFGGIRAGLALAGCVWFLTHVSCGGGGDDGGTASPPPATSGSATSPNGIARENALPGTSQWTISNPASNGEIAAYTNQESYGAGADVQVAVSANPAGSFQWRLFRLGGYRGNGGRLYAQGGPIAAQRQADPTFESVTGLTVAGWSPTFTIQTRDGQGNPWLTGVYLILLTKNDGKQTYSIFVLRDDGRDAEVVVHLPTATWHAYNNFGGESLYVSSHGLSGGHARKVSLDRPFVQGNGSSFFLYEEHEGVSWLEDQGYDVEYMTSLDLGGDNGRLGGHRLFISIGHDEYATMAAFDRLTAAIAAGTSLAFLTGNTMAWQVRYENGNRVMVGYKNLAAEDPMQSINPRLVTTNFRRPPVNRPENELLGVMSDGSHNEQPADWVVTNANHWVYQNTGLSNGSRIPGIVYYEWDSLVNNGSTPAGVTVLASSEVPNNITPGSRHEATVYERGRAFVFAASTIYFNQHLNNQPAAAQILKNLLTRAGATTYRP